ncbi:DNA-binding protein [Microbacterium sp. STN6]|uniref:PPC domain-containing DNA-binding protein n=1 Tax=Microbacterium sp. STN6 TaxID=2995588 RepID=UPI002260E8B9|nr:PPC domain-containing DNA-binding protein [Microbacterium sp. STN6]MCX7521451.1 DNA-binding protein [Microbacterium sp. STN6]
MQFKRIDGDQQGAGATYVVVLSEGDEAFATLSTFVKEHDLTAAQITAVGAFERAVVGWYDRSTKEYRKNPVDEQCEVLSLVGDAAGSDKGPQLHLHAVLGLADGTTRGGHLLEGHVWPTLEVIIRESPASLRKTMRPDVGLALIDLEKTA